MGNVCDHASLDFSMKFSRISKSEYTKNYGNSVRWTKCTLHSEKTMDFEGMWDWNVIVQSEISLRDSCFKDSVPSLGHHFESCGALRSSGVWLMSLWRSQFSLFPSLCILTATKQISHCFTFLPPQTKLFSITFPTVANWDRRNSKQEKLSLLEAASLGILL